jgi:hypothetical protein
MCDWGTCCTPGSWAQALNASSITALKYGMESDVSQVQIP